MARSMWKGSLAFGLVNIPIELYSATRDHRPKFRLLHAKDEAPIRYERVCQTEGKPVGWEDLVKGYEYEKGQFVVLNEADFKRVDLEATESIDIVDCALREPFRDESASTKRASVAPSGGDGRQMPAHSSRPRLSTTFASSPSVECAKSAPTSSERRSSSPLR